MRLLALFVFFVAGGVAAQDFYDPRTLDKNAADTKVRTYQRGVEQCWKVNVASTRLYTFTLSGVVATAPRPCVPVDGQLALYPPAALDPSVWMALVDTREGDECVALERRLTKGEYYICAATLLSETMDMVIQRTVATAPPTPSNDTCASPSVLAGASGIRAGETLQSAQHDYSPLPRGACAVASRAKGADRVWAFDLDSGDELSVNVRALAGNPTIYLVSDCARWWISCVAASEHPGRADEEIVYRNDGPAARFFLIVDTPRQRSATFDIEWVINR